MMKYTVLIGNTTAYSFSPLSYGKITGMLGLANSYQYPNIDVTRAIGHA